MSFITDTITDTDKISKRRQNRPLSPEAVSSALASGMIGQIENTKKQKNAAVMWRRLIESRIVENSCVYYFEAPV